MQKVDNTTQSANKRLFSIIVFCFAINCLALPVQPYSFEIIRGIEIASFDITISAAPRRRTMCPQNRLRNGRIVGEYLFHKNSGWCYRSAERGPCTESMSFEGNTIYDAYDGYTYLQSEYGECRCSASTNGFQSVFHPPTNRCYGLYSQGPCRLGGTLLLDVNNNPVCEFLSAARPLPSGGGGLAYNQRPCSDNSKFDSAGDCRETVKLVDSSDD